MGVPPEDQRIPKWLHQFLSKDYFSHCPCHSCQKNERKFFCIECIEGPLCRIGLQGHIGHVTLKVRRANHMDAVRVHDVQNLINIYNVQTYSINGASIVFLLCRPQHKFVKNAPYVCFTCKGPLLEALKFCSISCKLYSVHSLTDASATLSFAHESQSHSKANVDTPCTTDSDSPAFCSCTSQRSNVEIYPREYMSCTSQRSNVDQLQLPFKKRRLGIYPRECMRCSSQCSNVDQLQLPFKKRRLEIMASAPVDYEQRHENLIDLRYSSESGGEESSVQEMGGPILPFFGERREGFRVRRRKGKPHRSPFM